MHGNAAIRRMLPLAVLVWCCAVAGYTQPYKQELSPFTVLDARGSAYVNPFSGGLAQPRIGILDRDGDGTPDLFTLNPGERLRYYANNGTLPFHRVMPSPYDSLPVRTWFRFADVDGDGDDDLFTSGPTSEMLLIRNAGTQSAPFFLLPQPLLQAGGDFLYTQQETLPTFDDIDGDGDLDLFSGNIDGTITFYENTGTQQSYSFVKRTDVFEGITVISPGKARKEDAPRTQHNSAHGASVLAFADLDGDNDKDLLFGDFFTRKLLYFHNDGSATEYDFNIQRVDTAFRPAGDDVESDGFNQPITADLDGDGDIDVLISSLRPSTALQAVFLYQNQGTPTSQVMKRQLLDPLSQIDVGTYSAPVRIADATHNGILVGAEDGTITYFEAVQGIQTTEWRLKRVYRAPGLSLASPAVGDIDGDNIADIIVGSAFVEQNGLRRYTIEGNLLVNKPWQLDILPDGLLIGRNASPAFVDLDSDNDLDLFLGSEQGRFFYLENTGTPTAPFYEQATPPAPLDLLDVDRDSAPRFFDLDGDGDFDIIIGSRSTKKGPGMFDTLRFYFNDNDLFTERPTYPPLAVAQNPVPMIVDLPEGRFLIVGGQPGGLLSLRDTTYTPISSVTHTEAQSAFTISLTPTSVATSSSITLQWQNAGSGAMFVMTDAVGREQYRTPLQEDSGAFTFAIGAIPPGMYFYRASTSNATVTGSFTVLR